MDKLIPFVLLVDDDVDTCEVFQIALSQAGFLTRVAHSGEQAIALISQRQPNVILLDYLLGGRVGSSDVVAAIRSRHVESEVILLSAIGNPREKARQLNIQHSLQKPCDVEDLITLVRKLAGMAA